MKKIAICLPCFGRPERTKRAIECILAQTINNWEAYIVGDCCPDFDKIMQENRALGDKSWESRAEKDGNKIWMWNAQKHEGGWGYSIRNYVNHHNNAENILYLDNDDTIEPGHFYHRLRMMEDIVPRPDFIFCNTKCVFANYIRDAKMENGMIGHAELMIRSSFLEQHMEIQQKMNYGHDWDFIDQMVKAGARYEKVVSPYVTYNIMGAGELRETGID